MIRRARLKLSWINNIQSHIILDRNLLNLSSEYSIDPEKNFLSPCLAHESSMNQDHSMVHKLTLLHEDICQTDIQRTSFVILNYTLQFIEYNQRFRLLQRIYNNMTINGCLFLSEKIISKDQFLNPILTQIYEDFKLKAGYSADEILKKKEALVNVLIPLSEEEIIKMLNDAGFDHIEIIIKWNNFTTFIAIKSEENHEHLLKKKYNQIISVDLCNQIYGYPSNLHGHGYPSVSNSDDTHLIDYFFDKDPDYLYRYFPYDYVQTVLIPLRLQFYKEKLIRYDYLNDFCSTLLSLPALSTETNNLHIRIGDVIEIGKKADITIEQYEKIFHCVKELKPWKKGPFQIFDIYIDSEWRSDFKWNRIESSLLCDPHTQQVIPIESNHNIKNSKRNLNSHNEFNRISLCDKVIADVGCANGYFMYRMLSHNPKLVLGIDPNIKSFLEFQFFQKFTNFSNLKFEILQIEHLDLLPNFFDVIFCLGVLYHVSDPIAMLKKLFISMKTGSELIVDCQGIASSELATFYHRNSNQSAEESDHGNIDLLGK
jgi:tRNA (cmo5U34)-methyltransferase